MLSAPCQSFAKDWREKGHGWVGGLERGVTVTPCSWVAGCWGRAGGQPVAWGCTGPVPMCRCDTPAPFVTAPLWGCTARGAW